MNAEDFQDLYKLLRGSKSAFAVLDARTLFIEKKLARCLERIEEARESYVQSRSRLMKQPAEQQVDAKAADADRQIKRIQRKQDKVNDILKCFDELLPKLRKLADREKAKAVPDTSADSSAAADGQEIADGSELQPGHYERAACREDLTELFLKRFDQIEGDEQLLWVGKHFGFRQVESQDDIHPESLYFIKIEEESFLVQTRAASELTDGVALTSVTNNLPMKTYSHDAFVRMGVRKRMVLLTTEFEHTGTVKSEN
jgi:hypothetical protein